MSIFGAIAGADPGLPIGRGANLQGVVSIWICQIFPKNCLKLRKFSSRGEKTCMGAPPWIHHHTDTSLCFNFWWHLWIQSQCGQFTWCFGVESETLILNQFMHQIQILDGLKRSSETIHTWWMVSVDLLTPTESASNQILDGIRMSCKTIHHICMVLQDLLRPSKNLILIHKLIGIHSIFSHILLQWKFKLWSIFSEIRSNYVQLAGQKELLPFSYKEKKFFSQ